MIPFITEGIILFGILIAAFITMRVLSQKKKERYLKSFSDHISVLEYHMQKAYDMIHKDRILIYSIEGMKIEDKDFNAVSEDFVKLVIKLLGPMLYEEFLFLYGDENTFMFILIEYFNNKYEDDEIRRSALENIAENEASEESK